MISSLFGIAYGFVCYAPAFSLPPKSLTKQAAFKTSVVASYLHCIVNFNLQMEPERNRIDIPYF